MGLHIQKSGILTTIQDLGRDGYRSFGINPTGVMDWSATRLLNILVGNSDNEAVIEMHFPAPEIGFGSDCIAAIGGADFSATIDGQPIDNWCSFLARGGSILRFSKKISGNRCYLAVRNGLKVDKWLESSSTNLIAGLGGHEGRKLMQGDRIGLDDRSYDPKYARRRIAQSLIPLYRPFPTVRVIPGAEFGLLDDANVDLFENQDFSISNNSNRMGFRLSGKPLQTVEPVELVSSAVSFGTIQLLPDGQLIVLMAGHQTTGGYPRIAHVISRDLPLIAQLGANDKVAFFVVDVAHAEELSLEFEREVSLFRVAAK